MHRFILDTNGEATALSQVADVILPLSFVRIYGGGTTLTAYPRLEGISRHFLSAYGDDPTADEALSFLFRELAPYMREWGYADDRHRDKWGYILQQTKACQHITTRALPLTAEDQAHNLTTYKLHKILTDGRLAFGVKENGVIVSVALTHQSPQNTDHVEIGVETAVCARRRGYATASLITLVNALRERGIGAEYRCGRDNIGSYRTACAAGFAEIGKFYRYIGRRVSKNGL